MIKIDKYTKEYKKEVGKKTYKIVNQCTTKEPKYERNPNPSYILTYTSIEPGIRSLHPGLFSERPKNEDDLYKIHIPLDNYSKIIGANHPPLWKSECFDERKIGNRRAGGECIDLIIDIPTEDTEHFGESENRQKVTVCFE